MITFFGTNKREFVPDLKSEKTMTDNIRVVPFTQDYQFKFFDCGNLLSI